MPAISGRHETQPGSVVARQTQTQGGAVSCMHQQQRAGKYFEANDDGDVLTFASFPEICPVITTSRQAGYKASRFKKKTKQKTIRAPQHVKRKETPLRAVSHNPVSLAN